MADFTDAFTGTDGDDLEGRTGWTRVDGAAGSVEVNASNQLKASTTTETSFQAQAEASYEHFAEADVKYDTSGGTTVKRMFPVCINVQDKSNFIGIRHYNGNMDCYKRVAGTFTALFTEAETFTSGETQYLERSGTNLIVKTAGVARTNSPYTFGTDLNTITTPGIVQRSDTQDPLIDNWRSGTVAAGGISIPVAMHHYRQQHT